MILGQGLLVFVSVYSYTVIDRHQDDLPFNFFRIIGVIMLYEVLIPSSDPNGYDETITVDATNWMVALKSGLERTGEPEADIRNVMCDIKDDNSIHVTDAMTRRVFILREVDPEEDEEVETLRKQAAEAAEAERKAAEEAALKAAAEPPTPPPAQAPEQPAVESAHSDTSPSDSWLGEDGRMRVGSASIEALQREEEPARVVRSERRKTSEREPVQIGRAAETVSENILEDIFLEVQSIHENTMDMEQVVNFVMELAMSKVPAESGAVLFANSDGRELYFTTARGPKAAEVMDFRVPMGKGIVGFCARQGVSLAISDAQRDNRFYREISDALQYPTHSILCAPIQFEGRVYGCIELMNRQEGSSFSSNEVNAITYIGRQFAEYINRLIMEREKL